MKYLKLIRINQWYKNIVIFIPLFFSKNFLNIDLFLLTIGGFLALSFISSSYYIINDIRDREEDRKHPEKKHRAIASGSVSVGTASAISVILFMLSLGVSYCLNPLFVLFPLVLFLVTMAYTFWLKDTPILDVHIISLNFLIRTISGLVLIGIESSPWLFIIIFLLALVLALSKRRSEFILLGKNAAKHKKVFRFYTRELLDTLTLISVGMLLMSYTLYTFLALPGSTLIFSLPVVTFMVFRYVYLLFTGSKASRSNELVFKDKQILAGLVVWLSWAFLVIYLL